MVERQWLVVDAAGQNIGRLASQIATLLRGKHKPYYTPHTDCGDYVIVINAAKAIMSPKRAETKSYYYNTLYPGGARFKRYTEVQRKNPAFAIQHAVRGMLPKTSLGEVIAKKLRVFNGAEHTHAAQKPIPYTLPYTSKRS
ncbi:MAG: 50S ribosomal protein L13 [Bacteroidota bacterium]|nr:50S ribosomal protein L13 [Candidatus Kapabacteria bacterium]MDW8220008.1 50S ribosomal protein L13 [Bacteroidota bacterium]